MAVRKDSEASLALFTSLLLAFGTIWFLVQADGPLPMALAAAVLVAVAAYRLLTRASRRESRVRAQPLPRHWAAYLEERVPFFAFLDSEQRGEFLKRVQVFLATQQITGVKCEPMEEDRLLIAAIAIAMAFGVPEFRYPSHREVLLYPAPFDPDDHSFGEDGEWIGELIESGPIILSLPELRRAFQGDYCSNVCVHELAHLLDAFTFGDGEAFWSDSDPHLAELMADPLLVGQIELGASPLDDYALENRQEFFAVASEAFFEDPDLLLEIHPNLYAWLCDLYRQDPVAAWNAFEQMTGEQRSDRRPVD